MTDILPDTPQTPTYILYRRVSTDSQVERDISLPAQAREQHAYVTARDGLVVGEYEDGGESGRTASREGLLDALAEVKRLRPNYFLVHKSDRAFRNLHDAVVRKREMAQYGTTLVSVTEPFVGGLHPMEKAMEGIAQVINELYSENLSHEIKKGQKAIALDQGRQAGWVPYGYAYVNKVVQGSGWRVEETQGIWVRRMFAQILAGETLAEIARELNAAGVPTHARSNGHRRGAGTGIWYSSSVRQILSNRVYLGEVSYHGSHYPGAHPPLVEVEHFAKVQTLLTRRGKRRAESSERALFVGGLARCPRCASPMHCRCARAPAEGHGAAYHIAYRCGAVCLRQQARSAGVETDGCSGFQISQPRLLALLRAHLKRIAESHPPAPMLWVRDLAASQREAGKRGAEQDALRVELAKLARVEDGYHEQAAEGLLSMEKLRIFLGRTEERRVILAGMLADLDRDASVDPDPLTPQAARDLLRVLDDSALSTRQKRDSLRLWLEFVVPQPDKQSIALAQVG